MVKSFRVIGTSAVFLLLGWTVPAGSGQEQQDKPKNQEKHEQQDKPARQDQPHADRQQGQQHQQQQPQANRQQGQQQQKQRQHKTTPRNSSSKPEGNRISNASNINSKTTGQHNKETLLRYANSKSLGRVIAHIAGSPSTAPGSSEAGITATVFRMTVSVALMARITGSASTVSP
jgi:hypothetical protein